MNRILPNLKNMQNHDKLMHEKLIQEKQEKENLANLIQFQNKVNSDLAHKSREGVNPQEFNKEKCDEEDLKYRHTKHVAPNKDVIEPRDTSKESLRSFNEGLLNELKRDHAMEIQNANQEVNNLSSSKEYINL